MRIVAGNCMGGVTSLMVTSGGAYGLFGGKLATAWSESQWDTGY